MTVRVSAILHPDGWWEDPMEQMTPLAARTRIQVECIEMPDLN
jgi:hypothetical protein